METHPLKKLLNNDLLDDEEYLLKEQEAFLRSREQEQEEEFVGAPLRPAARVIRVNQPPEEPKIENEQPVKKISLFRQKMAEKKSLELEVMGEDDGSGVLTTVKECAPKAPSSLHIPDIPAEGFPKVFHRGAKNLGSKKLQKGNTGNGLMSLEASMLESEKGSSNWQYVQSMKVDERKQAIDEIKDKFGAKAIEFLTKRALQKNLSSSPSAPTPSQEEVKPAIISVKMNDETLSMSNHDLEKLLWTSPALPNETNYLPIREEKETSFVPTYMEVKKNDFDLEKFRFDFNGKLCTFTNVDITDSGAIEEAEKKILQLESQDELFYYRGLHHHGLDPNLPGYSLPELLLLSQSVHTPQAILALRTLAKIFVNAQLETTHCIDKSLLLDDSGAQQATSGYGLGLPRWNRYVFESLNIMWKLRALLDDKRRPIVRGALSALCSLLCPTIAKVVETTDNDQWKLLRVYLSGYEMIETATCIPHKLVNENEMKMHIESLLQGDNDDDDDDGELGKKKNKPASDGSFYPYTTAANDGVPVWRHSDVANFVEDSAAPNITSVILPVTIYASPSLVEEESQPQKDDESKESPVAVNASGEVNDPVAFEKLFWTKEMRKLNDNNLLQLDPIATLVLRTNLLNRLVALVTTQIQIMLRPNEQGLLFDAEEVTLVTHSIGVLIAVSHRSRVFSRLIALGHPPLRARINDLIEVFVLNSHAVKTDLSLKKLLFALLTLLRSLVSIGGEAVGVSLINFSSFISLLRASLSVLINPTALVSQNKTQEKDDGLDWLIGAEVVRNEKYLALEKAWGEDIATLGMSIGNKINDAEEAWNSVVQFEEAMQQLSNQSNDASEVWTNFLGVVTFSSQFFSLCSVNSLSVVSSQNISYLLNSASKLYNVLLLALGKRRVYSNIHYIQSHLITSLSTILTFLHTCTLQIVDAIKFKRDMHIDFGPLAMTQASFFDVLNIDDSINRMKISAEAFLHPWLSLLSSSEHNNTSTSIATLKDMLKHYESSSTVANQIGHLTLSAGVYHSFHHSVTIFNDGLCSKDNSIHFIENNTDYDLLLSTSTKSYYSPLSACLFASLFARVLSCIRLLSCMKGSEHMMEAISKRQGFTLKTLLQDGSISKYAIASKEFIVEAYKYNERIFSKGIVSHMYSLEADFKYTTNDTPLYLLNGMHLLLNETSALFVQEGITMLNTETKDSVNSLGKASLLAAVTNDQMKSSIRYFLYNLQENVSDVLTSHIHKGIMKHKTEFLEVIGMCIDLCTVSVGGEEFAWRMFSSAVLSLLHSKSQVEEDRENKGVNYYCRSLLVGKCLDSGLLSPVNVLLSLCFGVAQATSHVEEIPELDSLLQVIVERANVLLWKEYRNALQNNLLLPVFVEAAKELASLLSETYCPMKSVGSMCKFFLDERCPTEVRDPLESLHPKLLKQVDIDL